MKVLTSDFLIALEQVVLTPAKLTATDTWVLTRERPTSSDFSMPMEQVLLTSEMTNIDQLHFSSIGAACS